MLSSAIYEIIEWLGGASIGGDIAKTFVGAQQDPWDSQKDKVLATLAAFIALLAAVAVNALRQRVSPSGGHSASRPAHDEDNAACRSFR